MSTSAARTDEAMQAAAADLLAPLGETPIPGSWKRQFGGNARRAYRFDVRSSDGEVKPRILLSQVAAKHVESQTAQEFAVLDALNESGVRAPAAIVLDDEGAVTGGPALIMERVGGEASAVEFLRRTDVESGRALAEDLAVATADLHRFDWRDAGLAAGADPVLAQIDYWEESFRRHRLEPLPVLAWLFGWLRANRPDPPRLSLVHGDLRPGNFLYLDREVTALLDWEMAHIGDPAEDVAWIYRSLWSPERFLPIEQFLEVYAHHAGFALKSRDVLFYRIFSEAKFAAISAAAAHSVSSGGTGNLRHIDRAAKIPESLKVAMRFIDQADWEARHAAA